MRAIRSPPLLETTRAVRAWPTRVYSERIDLLALPLARRVASSPRLGCARARPGLRMHMPHATCHVPYATCHVHMPRAHATCHMHMPRAHRRAASLRPGRHHRRQHVSSRASPLRSGCTCTCHVHMPRSPDPTLRHARACVSIACGGASTATPAVLQPYSSRTPAQLCAPLLAGVTGLCASTGGLNTRCAPGPGTGTGPQLHLQRAWLTQHMSGTDLCN